MIRYSLIRTSLKKDEVEIFHASCEKERCMQRLQELIYIPISEKKAEEGFLFNKYWYQIRKTQITLY